MTSQCEQPPILEEWAGSPRLSLALVFTDIVMSTKIGKRLGDHKWIDDLFKHFSKGREIASRYDSHVVKVIGDSLMLALVSREQVVLVLTTIRRK